MNFLKTTAIGGFVVIIPLSVALIVLGSVLDTLVDIGNKVSPHLPYGMLGHPVVVVAIAAGTIISLCFITGLLLVTSPGKALGEWMDRNIAQKIPMYGMVKNLTAQFAGLNTRQFQPVEADIYGSGSWVLGFLIEELDDGRLIIFVPSTPMATVGMSYCIPTDRVNELNVPMKDVAEVVTQWGAGSAELMRKHNAAKTEEIAAKGE